MKRYIQDNFSGMLDLQGIGNNEFDSFFNICNNLVTIIPLTDECRKYVHILRNDNDSNERGNWLYGISEDNCNIAFLQKKPLSTGFSFPVDMCTSRVYTPLIVKSVTPGVDLRTFDSIEFYGGIVDILHIPTLAAEFSLADKCIRFVDKNEYTRTYNVEINEENFKLSYSVSTADLVLETGNVPDLKTAIHSVLRFDFETEKPLSEIEKYYSYAMKLFQFCTGHLNIAFEIRLYKNEFSEGKRVANSYPILVKIKDSFHDYANDILDLMKVIRLQFFDDKFPKLFKLLNEINTQPHLLFLTKRNTDKNNILYTDIGDICVALEREFSLFPIKSKKTYIEKAQSLTEDLMNVIDTKNDIPEPVKKKATDILNSQLKGFSPSLKEKICTLYDDFEQPIKSITEIENHDKLGISKFYTLDEFKNRISKFVDIRNKASHSGIVWNEGTDIFNHLRLLIYFCILRRAEYTPKESTCMLSWLFGRLF